MNDVLGNVEKWSRYSWLNAGDEWSIQWGTTANLWRTTLFPRIEPFLPANHILEIAPGYGRITNYLKDLATNLSIVDLNQNCIDACRQRFAGQNHIQMHVNDGRSLDMIEDNSVDFAISWDSLVHCEFHILEPYIRQLAAKLKDGAYGFIHHANVAACSHYTPQWGWRAQDVSAQKVADVCRAVGLTAIRQEQVPWIHDTDQPMDCFTTFKKGEPDRDEPRGTWVNLAFRKEFEAAEQIARHYNQDYALWHQAMQKQPLTEHMLTRLAGKKLIGWGGGQVFLRTMENHPFPLTGIIDTDPEKTGTTLNGIPVLGPEHIAEVDLNEHFIIIFTDHFYPDIYRKLIEMGLRVREHFYYFSPEEIDTYKTRLPRAST